jgi:hypothetical protein
VTSSPEIKFDFLTSSTSQPSKFPDLANSSDEAVNTNSQRLCRQSPTSSFIVLRRQGQSSASLQLRQAVNTSSTQKRIRTSHQDSGVTSPNHLPPPTSSIASRSFYHTMLNNKTPSSTSPPSPTATIPDNPASLSSQFHSKPNHLTSPDTKIPMQAEPLPPSISNDVKLDMQQAGGTMHVQSGAAVPVAVTIEPNDSLNVKEALLSSSPPPETNTIELIVPSDTRSMEDTSVDTTSLSKFMLFPNFPPELRLNIWKYALRQRIIEIEYCHSSRDWFLPVESQRKPAGLFRANKKSERFTLKIMHQISLFSSVSVLTRRSPTSYQDCYHDFLGVGNAYFDPAVDMLYIGPSANGAPALPQPPLTN